MASLYEIDAEIMACLDLETGEIIDSERLDALQIERKQKIENVACWVKNLEADAAAYGAEMEAFKARKSAAENKAERLKAWLVEATGGEKMTMTRAAISFRASERVEIVNAESIPHEYMIEKITSAPDKKAIKDAMKAGCAVEGCELVKCLNVQIK